jgi:predicted transposase YbfD/YdcC
MDADQRYKDSISQDQKEKNVEVAKIKRAQDLYMKAQTLATVMDDHIAKRYLTEHRGIERVVSEGRLSSDIQTTSMWDNHTKQHYESLVVMARSEKGEITGGQAIYLDKESAKKADTPVNKRSFGKISGSFVTIQSGDEVKGDTRDNTRDDTRDNNKLERATIIAEGVETALSIQEAGTSNEVKILCSLGVSNIKNYEPFKGEKILLCADNDGIGASSLKAIEGARNALEEKGAIVNIIMPKTAGADFNDVLKSEGAKVVHDQVNLALEGLAKDNGLDRVVSKITTVCSDAKDEAAKSLLSDHLSELKNIAPESLQSILDVCKSEGVEKGLASLGTILKNTKVQKEQQFASFLNYHSRTLKDIAALNPKIDTKALIEHLNHIGKDLTPKEALKEQKSHIDSVLVKSFQDKVLPELKAISRGFEQAKNPLDVMKTMQQEKALYSDIEKNYWNLSKVALTKDQHEKFMYNAVFHEDHPEYFKTLERDVSTLSKLDIWPTDKITETLRSEPNFFTLEKKVFKGCQDHITHDVTKDLHHIDEHKSIERDGHKFEDHKSYLEHRINDKDHGHYLTDTQPHKMLKQIYKVEQAKLDQQKELEMHKSMDKGHDMSM